MDSEIGGAVMLIGLFLDILGIVMLSKNISFVEFRTEDREEQMRNATEHVYPMLFSGSDGMTRGIIYERENIKYGTTLLITGIVMQMIGIVIGV